MDAGLVQQCGSLHALKVPCVTPAESYAMQGQFAFRLFVKVGGSRAGTPIQSITAAVKTQDQAMIVAGLANGTALVVHVTLANRSVSALPSGA